MARPPLDLAGGGGRVLVGDGDRALKAAVLVVAAQPGIGQPIVEGGGDGGAEVRVRVQVAEGAGEEDAVPDPVLVHELPAQELRIRARAAAVGGLRVQAGALDRIAKEAPATAAVAVLERRRHERSDLIHILGPGMDVAVDDAGAGWEFRHGERFLSD